MLVTINESEVVNKVRINLDEIGVNDSEFDSGTDESELDSIIKSKIGEAYRFVLCHCDSSMLTPEILTVKHPSTVKEVAGIKVGYLECFDGFLRFVYAKYDAWPYPVYEAIPWNNPAYATLSNPFTTGTPERPKVGIKPIDKFVEAVEGEAYAENGIEIDLYSLVDGVYKPSVAYIKYSGKAGETMKLTDVLYDSFIYYVTALTLLTLRDSHSDAMMAQALSLIGIDTSKAR